MKSDDRSDNPARQQAKSGLPDVKEIGVRRRLDHRIRRLDWREMWYAAYYTALPWFVGTLAVLVVYGLLCRVRYPWQ
jgi:hypothetical protein